MKLTAMRLVSPVFGKEMVTLARRKSQFAVRGLMLGTLLIVMASSWTSTTISYGHGLIDTSDIGRQLFMFFAITQLIAVAILVPALTSPVIAGEKDKNTLGLLLMSNLSLYHLLLDKLLSRFALMALLLLSGMPLFIALLAFGGITPGQIFGTYISIFATILFCGGIGLLTSTIMNKTHTAMIATYATIICYVMFLSYMLLENSSINRVLWLWFFPTSIFEYPHSYGSSFIFLAWSGIIFLFCLVLSKELLPYRAGQVKRQAIKRISHRMNAFFKRINFTGVEIFQDEKTVTGNAIFWKEARKSFFSSNTFIIRACYTFIILSMILMAIPSSLEYASYLILWGGVILLALIAIIASSTAFAAEREKHSLDILLSTPLTARSIVLAKFTGVLKLMLPVVICLGIWLVAWRLVNSFHYDYYNLHRGHRYWFYIPLILAVDLPMLIVIGLFSSATQRRTGAAILQSFLIFGGWNLVPALLAFYFDRHGVWLNFIYPGWDESVSQFVLSMTPAWSLALVFANRFYPLACLFLIPICLYFLNRLINRFDAMVGRQ